MPLEEARRIVDADFRPPIRRGDLDAVAPGSVVGIIDGVFNQSLAVSPREIREALGRGIRVFGSSSMGALRAAEVPGIVGVGHVYRMFASGVIENDDEVAVAFDPVTLRAASEPLVNIRYAVERLVRPGTLSQVAGRRIISAARRLHYSQRIYPTVLRNAGITDKEQVGLLCPMLSSYDLKREDAATLLEHILRLPAADVPGADAEQGHHAFSLPYASETTIDGSGSTTSHREAFLFWEYGERISFEELLTFIKCTGRFRSLAWSAIVRQLVAHEPVELVDPERFTDQSIELRRRFHEIRVDWDWKTTEEFLVTLSDLGLSKNLVAQAARFDAQRAATISNCANHMTPGFCTAVRAELFSADLELKREVLRCGSLQRLAALDHGEKLADLELAETRTKVCEQLDFATWRGALDSLAEIGVDHTTAEAFVSALARARRAARTLYKPAVRRKGKFRLPSSPKISGSGRFCTPQETALKLTPKLRRVVGITRVSMITGLGDIGLPIAQAFRPNGLWSSTIGGGKAVTVAGAKVGSVMEEVEKWAQEQFPLASSPPEVSGTFVELGPHQAIDPGTLDLPYDTCYQPELRLAWRALPDLITGRDYLTPSAAIDIRRLSPDIYYSERAGRKVKTTNGLASGFTLAEAATHAICELIERHAMKRVDIAIANPGAEPHLIFPFVDIKTTPESTRRICSKVVQAGHFVRLVHVTSDVRVPTFWAAILVRMSVGEKTRFGQSRAVASGHATHPDPEVAANMAILEAAQNIMTHIAGAREDLNVHSRSLGRHERTHATSRYGRAFLHRVDSPIVSFASLPGYRCRDARDDVWWIVRQMAAAGVQHLLLADYSLPEIYPARVVRALAPGLDTTNPFHSGPRIRALLLRDLLPHDCQ